jgi:two-component system sensor histidine kinase PilS (NtrC family)
MEMSVRGKLLWLIAARAAAVTLLLGSAILVQINDPGTLAIDPFFYLIGLTYGLTAFYALTLRIAEQHRWLVDVQLVSDALIVSAVVLLSGGVTSYFSSLYALPIVAASVLQFRRGGLMVGTLSALMFAGLVLAQYTGALVLPAAETLPPVRVAAFSIGLNTFGFLSVALLSGYLAEGLRRADAQLEQTSSELADLQAFNQHVLDSLTSGLLTTDREDRILTFNRAAEAITGLPEAHAVGRPVDEVLQLPPGWAVPHGRLLEATRGRRIEIPLRRGDGREIELGYSSAPLMTPNGPAGTIFMFQDVTEIRKTEREMRVQQRLAAVGEMAAGIAHEIRNPLASMAGSIQILRQELPLSEEQAQLMDIVLRESERLNDTIRSFLAYARPQRLSTSRMDLGQVLRDAATLLRNSTECREDHEIVLDLPPSEVWYEADEGQVRQIVWNLATNGLRAMRDGGRLTLAAGYEQIAAAAAGLPSNVVFSVRDEGVGIPPEELDQIFQPFRGAFERGTGLGLAIVHRIVSDYGGEVEVSSQPGSGTTVKVRLPAPAAIAVR